MKRRAHLANNKLIKRNIANSAETKSRLDREGAWRVKDVKVSSRKRMYRNSN